MPNISMQEKHETLERISEIKSPVARRVVTKIAEAVYSGRLSGNDLELIEAVAEQMANRNESSLSQEESNLIKAFRSLNDSQRDGAVRLLTALDLSES
jgi:hypothetical protein